MDVEVSGSTLGDVVAEKLFRTGSSPIAVGLSLAGLGTAVIFACGDYDGVSVAACSCDGFFDAHAILFL